MKMSDLRKENSQKLVERLIKKQKELMNKRLTFKIGKGKDIGILSKSRKDIARIKTVIKEKEILSD